MDKGIGFNRTITQKWLNVAANLRSQTDDLQSIRQGLEDVLLQDMHGVDARRKTIDVLVNIWLKSEMSRLTFTKKHWSCYLKYPNPNAFGCITDLPLFIIHFSDNAPL